jgi:hypothetical protein
MTDNIVSGFMRGLQIAMPILAGAHFGGEEIFGG